ncbi:hypothetical protein EBU99_09635 [bacterium]|nr:hypothetical protein [bacterium]
MASSLLQRILPNHKIQHHIFKMVLYFALLACAGMFANQLNQQRKAKDANATRETLKQAEDARTIENVKLTYYYCQDTIPPEELDNCISDSKSRNILIPSFRASFTEIPEIKGELSTPQKANWVKIIYELSPEDKAWLSNKKRPRATLLLPRNVHMETWIKYFDTFIPQFGLGADTTFGFFSQDLLQLERIELRLRPYKGVSFFGPADFPAALVRPDRVERYAGLTYMQKEAANLTRQLQLGLPVVLAAIAIILDHSVVMSYLALYGASRAAHDFIAFKTDNGIPLTVFEDYLYRATCGFGFAFLVLFTATIVGLNVRRIKLAHRWLFVLVMGTLFAFGNQLDKSFSTTSDLWGDSLAISASFLVIIYAAYDWIKNPPTAETKASNPETYSRLSVALVVTRLALVCAAFSIHWWVNISELIGVHSEDANLKNPLDWKHMLLMPSLMTAALLEVGSTAKKMLTFGRDMATKALIEQELNVGREVQARMLPALRTTTSSWQWRAMYMPAEALAGDWFDIRELNFADGRTLLAVCVADVTGHGVGSSLATSVICSHWGLWCEGLQAGNFPETPDMKQAALKRAPYAIHMGLQALRENENCTSIFALLDPSGSDITFCSAGHPGILVMGNKTFRYFTTQGERLGSDVLGETTWNAKTEVLSGDELVVLYSDGVVPLRATVSSWAAQLKRKVTSGTAAAPELLLVNQLRANKHGFVDAPELKDDMTLVMIRRKSKGQAPTQEPSPQGEQGGSPSADNRSTQIPQSA